MKKTALESQPQIKEDNIKIDRQKVGLESMVIIQLFQDT
jgi:hypothetical protein